MRKRKGMKEEEEEGRTNRGPNCTSWRRDCPHLRPRKMISSPLVRVSQIPVLGKVRSDTHQYPHPPHPHPVLIWY